MVHSASKLMNSLLHTLGDRQRDIIVSRYGLEPGGEVKTLAELGARYKITRERVRQLESAALKLLRAKILKDPAWSEVIAKSSKYLKDCGGVVRSSAFLEELQSLAEGINLNQLILIAEAAGVFNFHPEDKDYYSFFYLDKESLKSARDFIDQWTAFLRSKKALVLSGKYHHFLEEFVKRKGIKSLWAFNFLAISKKIARNPYGDVGLREWAEIAPKTIRDRVYLILKKKKEPLHFRVIAQTINDVFAHRRASVPTVHNELIKDSRFVLVGRGMYALREHGYEPGTAREVIKRILKKNGPLRPREVILAVQKERFFKPNTILVNLQNKAHFVRQANGTYRIREA
jgi:hypothetical protein